MASVRSANLGLRFLLELGLLVGVGWWGEHAIGWWAAVLFPLGAAVVWGSFLSPKARWTIPSPARLVLELLLFALAAVGYWRAGQPGIAAGFAIAVALSEAVQWSGSSRPA
jgi:Protein of unknown function (DUF2568)